MSYHCWAQPDPARWKEVDERSLKEVDAEALEYVPPRCWVTLSSVFRALKPWWLDTHESVFIEPERSS